MTCLKTGSQKTSNLEVGLADRETETKRRKQTGTEKQTHSGEDKDET